MQRFNSLELSYFRAFTCSREYISIKVNLSFLSDMHDVKRQSDLLSAVYSLIDVLGQFTLYVLRGIALSICDRITFAILLRASARIVLRYTQ